MYNSIKQAVAYVLVAGTAAALTFAGEVGRLPVDQRSYAGFADGGVGQDVVRIAENVLENGLIVTDSESDTTGRVIGGAGEAALASLVIGAGVMAVKPRKREEE